jgi:hypothetical protein
VIGAIKKNWAIALFALLPSLVVLAVVIWEAQ